MDMQGLAAMAIGVLTLIVAFTIIPIVGDQLDSAVPLPGGSCTYPGVNATGCDAGYKWNNTARIDGSTSVTGIDLWTSVGGILKVAGIIIVVAGFLKTLQSMRE